MTEAEITRLAEHLHLTEREFIEGYTRLNSNRTSLALRDKPNGECILLNGMDCSVNPVKPQQCRDFPNLWNFPGFQKVCKARPKLMEQPEYREAILASTGQSIQK